jgi:hypothetical protein
LIFVSGAQTPSPLIRPAGPILGVAVRGKRQNQAGDDEPVCVLGELHGEALDQLRDG